MASASQLDTFELTNLSLPYDADPKLINDQAKLVSGSSNVYVDRNNRIRKCGGLVDQSLDIAGHRVDRLIEYDCENDRKYLVASCYDTANTNWTVYYLRLDGASAWTEIPDLRNVRDSEYPHEMIAARGQVYIKGFPGAAGDKLDSVIFDGRATPKTTYWGLLGPTVAARRTGATSSWSASATSDVNVRIGWQYVYAWETAEGHVSSRSPIESDTALQPSTTGAFENKVPQMVVQGHADTTNIPNILVYRTFDGGGHYLLVDTITNTGAGNITYSDTNRTTTPGDPKEDSGLDTAYPAPSLTSNSPPPTVEEGVIGTDTVERCSPIQYWNGRLWYSVGSNLYFSGNDEIRAGNIEDSFPTGVVTGNRIKMRGRIKSLIPTNDYLNASNVYETISIRGSARNDILGRQVLSSIGSSDERRGSTHHETGAIWIDQRNRIRIYENQATQVLSDPLNTEITGALDADTAVSILIYQQPKKDWLVAALHDNGTPANSRWWIMDLSRVSQGNLWSPPWTKDTSAICVATTEAGVTNLYATVFDGTDTSLTIYDDGVYADLGTGYAAKAVTNLFSLPDGNHVHRLAQPRLMCPVKEIKVGYVGNQPVVEYGLDTAGALTTASVRNPPPRAEAADAGYKIGYWPIEKVAERARISVSRTADTEAFVVESLGIVWDPTQGD